MPAKKSDKVNELIGVVFRKLAGMLVLGLLLAGGFGTGCSLKQQECLDFQQQVLWETTEEVTEDVTEETEETDGPEEEALFVVHICGAVQEPGVYELTAGSRVMDAVEAAGGFAMSAARDARNLAETVQDGSMIRIPTQEEAAAETAADDGKADLQQRDTRVNINTADAALLQTLPGIGAGRAQDIIGYRERYGRFSCIEDIMKVAGIKQATFEKLKDQITV